MSYSGMFSMDMFEIFPTNKMTFDRKINAIIRLVVILCFLGYIITQSPTFIITGICTIIAIYVLYFYQTNKERMYGGSGNNNMKEGFEEIKSKEQMNKHISTEYTQTTKSNPFSNVLMNEYTDNPERKAAAPAFNPVVMDSITSNIKQMVQGENPTIENSSHQLFGGLYEKFDLDQSNRAFFSTANTKIPNDQGSFADFLYGDMPSGKLNGEQRVKDNLRYNLY
jgi:Family of unknown function (DUF5762)